MQKQTFSAKALGNEYATGVSRPAVLTTKAFLPHQRVTTEGKGMASNKKPNHSAKVKYWADGVTGECSGGIVGCIEMLFFALPKDKREACLKRCEEAHKRCCEHEEKKKAEQAA